MTELLFVCLIIISVVFAWLLIEIPDYLQKYNRANKLYYCPRKDTFFRGYQISSYNCPICGNSHNFYGAEKTFKWMDEHPNFKKLSLVEYIKFKRLEKLIAQQADERESFELFQKHWKKNMQ